MPQPPVQLWRDAIMAADLDATAKLVGLVLACHATADGRARLSRGTLAGAASLGLSTVDRAVRRLEDGGLLAVVRAAPGAGRRVTNRYRAVIPNSPVLTLFPGDSYDGIASLTTRNSPAAVPVLERELEEPRARDTAANGHADMARTARREFMARLEARA